MGAVLVPLGAALVMTLGASCGSSGGASATTTEGGAVVHAAGGKGGAGGVSGASGQSGAAGHGGLSSGGAGGAGGKSGAAGQGGSGGSAGSGGSTGGSSAGGKGGAAMCVAPLKLCGQSCVDVTSDPHDCGACGNVCAAGSSCCSSMCETTTSCSALSVDAVVPASGWQNGGAWVTLHGKGFTPGAKVFVGDGRAPAEVVDASTIVLSTPPHLAGVVDIRVQQGGATLLVSKAFTYQTGAVALPWQTKPMKAVRGENPGVAVMVDGRVLVAGGTLVPGDPTMSVNTAELYDRTLDKVVPATGTMSTPRWQASAIALLDGRVLVVGGACGPMATGCTGDATFADLFDPKTSSFSPTKKPLQMSRVYTRAVLLADGRVLIASSNDPSLEIFDPVTGSFTLVAHTTRHSFGFVVRLLDGRVMLGGGDPALGDDGANVELFDPDTMMFTTTTSLNTPRTAATAHTLPDGRVAVIGGADKSADPVDAPENTMEAWSALTSMWATSPATLLSARAWHTSALMRDGTILVLGGYTMGGSCVATDSVDQADLVLQSVTGFGSLPSPTARWTATTLLDGSVVAVGGGACTGTAPHAEINFLAAK